MFYFSCLVQQLENWRTDRKRKEMVLTGIKGKGEATK